MYIYLIFSNSWSSASSKNNCLHISQTNSLIIIFHKYMRGSPHLSIRRFPAAVLDAALVKCVCVYLCMCVYLCVCVCVSINRWHGMRKMRKHRFERKIKLLIYTHRRKKEQNYQHSIVRGCEGNRVNSLLIRTGFFHFMCIILNKRQRRRGYLWWKCVGIAFHCSIVYMY